MKICKICKKEFEPNHWKEECCTDDCKRINHLQNMRKAASHKVKKQANTFYKGNQCKHKDCKYKGKVGQEVICDFLGKAGRARGCEANNCDKYEKKTEPRRKNQICLGVGNC